MRGLIDDKFSNFENEKKLLNIYISTTVNPFLEGLLENIYIQNPRDLHSFTRKYVDKKSSKEEDNEEGGGIFKGRNIDELKKQCDLFLASLIERLYLHKPEGIFAHIHLYV